MSKSSSHLVRLLAMEIKHSCDDSPSISILDVGGASGRVWLGLLCECINLTIVDPFLPQDLDFDPAGTRILGTFEESLPQLAASSFDLVVALDVIEHLSRVDGYRLLYQMERVARGSVLVYTPNGFVWQPPSTNNQLNAHVSGWTISDFRSFGFSRFSGHVNLKWLVGPYAEPRFSISNPVWQALWLVGMVLVRLAPSTSFAISAIMQKGQRDSVDQQV